MTVSAAEPRESWMSIDRNFQRTYTSEYLVKSDTVHESPRNVINATGIPAFRSTYAWPPAAPTATDAWAFAASASARLMDRTDRLHWIVTVVHQSSRPDARPVATEIQNPVDEPARFEGGQRLVTRTVHADRDGQPLWNSSEQPFPDQTLDFEIPTISVRFNTDTINLSQRSAAIGTVNSLGFWGYPVNTVKLADWSYFNSWYGPSDTPFISHEMLFVIDLQFHRLKIVDEGTRSLVDPAATDPNERYSYEFFEKPDGTPVIRALDGSGGLIDYTSNPLASAVQLEFDMLTEYDFTGLPCPQVLPNPPFEPYV